MTLQEKQTDGLLSKVKEEALSHFVKLSKREQLLVIGGVGICLFLILNAVVVPFKNALARQAAELVQVKANLQSLPIVLERHMDYKARLQEAEREYKDIELQQGALATLESIIKTSAGIQSGFTIKDLPKRTFGNDYEQSPFVVKFRITDFPRLITFLKDLVHGDKPFVLSTLSLRKPSRGERVDVELEVSSIRKIKP